MCFSLAASRNAFLVNLVSCAALLTLGWKRKEARVIALFFGFVGLMQLYDWIFWANLQPNRLNYVVTKLAMISNHMQPIVLALLLCPPGYMSIAITSIYAVYACWYSITMFSVIKHTMVHPRTSPYLFWEWNSGPGNGIMYALFFASLCILFLENFAWPLNLMLLTINVATFVLSGSFFKSTIIGQFWCLFASYTPLVLLLMFAK